MVASFSDLLARLWDVTGAPTAGGSSVPAGASLTGPRIVLPFPFDVTGLATGVVAAATLAAAELHAMRRSSPVPPVTVDSVAACTAFRAEQLFSPIGWTLPSMWDPLSGNYRANDGWIRLHTNYACHREAVQGVLRAEDRDAVQAAASVRSRDELEGEIVAAGGAAAGMRTREEWLASPAGRATADAPAVEAEDRGSAARPSWAAAAPVLPFSGVRVLDLTRVIAGPVCTKFLAAYGADVLRLDPPGFEEVASLLPETTLGKRTASIDLTAPEGRSLFEEMVAVSDVIVVGYRADALTRLGYDDDALVALNPNLIVARLNAYGWSGPWQNRRGFDSLVQMSCGIAEAGSRAYDREEPTPLPAQALDHASGWLLGAAIARALARQLADGVTTRIRGSLIGTANLLCSLDAPANSLVVAEQEPVEREETATEWGPALRVPLPGDVEGVRHAWRHPAGSLGRHPATFLPRA